MEIIARMGEIKINAHKEITISKTHFPRNLYIGKLIPGPRLPDFKFAVNANYIIFITVQILVPDIEKFRCVKFTGGRMVVKL